MQNQLRRCFNANHIEVNAEKRDHCWVCQRARVRIKGSNWKHFHVEKYEVAIEREVSIAVREYDNGEENSYE